MNKNLLKTVPLAIGLAVGMTALTPIDANAQASKRILDSENYEQATAADWSALAASTVTLVTGDEVYGNYVSMSPSGSGNRGLAKTVTFDSQPTGYTSDQLDTEGYVIEFDALLRSGARIDRSQSQFIVATQDPNSYGNTGFYTGSDYVFSLSQPTRDASSYSTAWYVNDKEHTTSPITLEYRQWYHYKITVSKTSIDYVISTSDGIETASGSKDVSYESVPQITGFWTLAGREGGLINFDNLEIYDYVAGIVANAPIITLTGINGTQRTYSISYAEGETLHYQLPGELEYATENTVNPVEVSTSTSGTLSAYATNGEARSATVEEVVEAVAITLNAPTYIMSNISDGFNKDYTVSIDNSELPLSPVATMSYVFTPVGGTPQAAVPLENGGTINSTAAGTYIVTATASGYTSSTVTIENTVPYELVNEYNFSEMTEDDFSDTELWTSGTDNDSRWGWSDEAPGIKFELNDPATNAATVFEGLTLFTNKVPTIYVGYGLMAPYENGNYGVLTLTDAQEGQYAIYTYLNNYGRSTLVTVQEATESYSLYRYSDMLQSIKVYAPAIDINVTIGEAGLATYTPSVALDFTNATNIAAYKASVSGDVVNLTRVNTVAAGEGVLIRSLNGGAASEDIAVATEAVEKAADNMFIGTLTDIEALASEADGFANYILNDGEMGLGFYQANDQKVAAGKAYLQVPAASANRIMFFSLDGETTGISNVEAEAEQGEKVYYNLNGQRIDTPNKGLYIVNGKKVIIK